MWIRGRRGVDCSHVVVGCQRVLRLVTTGQRLTSSLRAGYCDRGWLLEEQKVGPQVPMVAIGTVYGISGYYCLAVEGAGGVSI